MYQPLAELLRPTTLDEVYGQDHILSKGAVLRRLIDSGKIPNMVFCNFIIPYFCLNCKYFFKKSLYYCDKSINLYSSRKQPSLREPCLAVYAGSAVLIDKIF